MDARAGAIVVALALASGSMACRDRPSDAELSRLQAEAEAANREATRTAPKSNQPGFTLSISGQIDKPPATLGWSDLQKLGQTHVKTLNPQSPDRTTQVDFRGVLLRDLLAKYGARTEATEATVISVDGFRATFQIDDAKKYDILLAIEADGKPIAPSSGGPIFLIYPFSDHPEIKDTYPDRFWAFYVTSLVVGTESPQIVVRAPKGNFTLHAEDLDHVDHATMTTKVSWKVEWPSDEIHLRGVRLKALLDSIDVDIPDGSKLLIRGKSPLYNNPTKPILIDEADLDECTPLLAMQWGPLEKPITARQGGPIALAFSTACPKKYDESSWVTLVEEIEVVPP
ncbi:MAG TPA: molybdopterin-dependent oxidoreductase [Kofleriaceae bacterium]